MRPLTLAVVCALTFSLASGSGTASPPNVAAQCPCDGDGSSEHFLRWIYSHYPQEHFSDFQSTRKDARSVFAPVMLRAIEKDRVRAHGEEGRLDFDPLCFCQDDGGLEVIKIAAPEMIAHGSSRVRQEVTLRFNQMPRPRLEKIVFTIDGTDGVKRIVDAGSGKIPSVLRFLQ